MTLDERISLYLAKCPPAVSGADGHGATFRVACALVNGFGLDPETAFRHLTAYNITCNPPWKPRELRHKIEQAGKVVHQKPRGHLLGRDRDSENGGGKIVQGAPKLVPVRLTPRKRDFGTVGTVFSEPYVKACAHTCVRGIAKQSSQPSLEPDEMVLVPGCTLARPAEIEMADDDWRALAASGLGEEPLVQYAVQLFGPGCRVIKPEVTP